MTIGIDLGATKIATGLVNEKGKVLKKVKVETGEEKGIENTVKNIIFSIEQVTAKEIKRIGIGVAGQIDIKRGIDIFAHNMAPAWKDVPLKKLVVQAIKSDLGWRDFQIQVDNDSNCFTLGEALFGAGKGKRFVVGLTLGSGIGGGIVIDGKIYHGQAFASEIGHMVVEANGRICPCSKTRNQRRGCLEAYAAGRAIEKRYKELTGKEKIATDIEKEAGASKNSIGYKVYMEAGKYLGVGLANIVNVLDPEIIIIGGGLGKAKMLYAPAKAEMKRRTFFRDRETPVVQSKLGDEAGIVGAACIAK